MTFREFHAGLLNTLRQLRTDIALPFVYIMLRTKKFEMSKDLLDFACSGSFGAIKPSQVRPEIEKLLELLNDKKAKNGLEVGTNNGGTLFLFANTIRPGGMLVSVDLPGGLYGGGYSPVRIPFYQSFARRGSRINLIRADSHSPETLAKVKKATGGTKLDFIFIDGDHAYEGVKKDFEMYSPLVKKGGLIIFHDIAVHPLELRCDVHRFWNEIKKKYKHTEFIEAQEQSWAGIGVIYRS